jgi:hypothetical protein
MLFKHFYSIFSVLPMIQLHTFSGIQEQLPGRSAFHGDEEQYRNFSHITRSEELSHLQNTDNLLINNCDVSSNSISRFHRQNNHFEVSMMV